MLFKGIDNTFGSKSLESIAEQIYNDLDEFTQFKEFQLCQEFKRDMETSWLLNLICGYDRKSYNLGDMLWYKKIKEMIIKGTLFIRLIPIESWAFRDIEIQKNISNLANKMPITFDFKNKRNSDGLFTLGASLEMFKVYPTDDEIEEKENELESIEIEKPHGVAEFGTQKICKSAMTLLSNELLLRVPYNNSILRKLPTPFAAFFFNTEPYYKKIDFLES